MKVFLLKDVQNVGQRGTIVEVKNGFGRNYLIARGLARFADAHAFAEARAREAHIEKRRAAKEQLLAASQKELTGRVFIIQRKANDKGVLFAAVTWEDIAGLFKKEKLPDISKEHVHGVPLKTIGEHTIDVHLAGVRVPVTITIEPL